MLGRDKITIHFQNNGPGGRADETTFSRTFMGRIITEDVDGKIEPFGGSLVFTRYFRLLLPRNLDLSGGNIVNVDFGDREGARFEKAIVPIYDGHGRVHHYEGVVRSSG